MLSDINTIAKFYQNVGLWPRTSKLNYKGWLSNFDNDNDLELAKMILNFFVFYSDDLVDQLIIAAVGKCGYKLQELNGSWNYDDFKNNCWYGFVPGEHPHDSDSGHIFIRKVRDVLRINEDRELKFQEIVKFFGQKNARLKVAIWSGKLHRTAVLCRWFDDFRVSEQWNEELKAMLLDPQLNGVRSSLH